MFKKIRNYFKGFFTINTLEDAVLNTIFWLVLVFGGAATFQSVGRYLVWLSSPYATLFGIGFLIIVLLIAFINIALQVKREQTGGETFWHKKF